MTPDTSANGSLAVAIGQTLCIGFPGKTLTEPFREFVREHKIGNVILFSHNIESARQLSALTAEIHALIQEATGAPAFITIDQEGGVVQRLPQDAVPMPGAMAVAATGSPENARRVGRFTAQQLRALGINVNLAPCADVNSNPNNPVIGVRSYGSDPEQVSAYAMAMAQGLMEGGILPCVKHFPGHGDTAVDSHIGLPVVEKNLTALYNAELLPFRRAIEANIPCVMSSHIVFPALDADGLPATLSKSILTGLLRKKLGFSGLILTDCLEMGAIQERYGTAKGACMALAAGADIAFISHTLSLAEEAVQKITEAVRSGALPQNRLFDAARRILAAKARLQNMPAPNVTALNTLRQQALAIREQSLGLLRGSIRTPDADTLFLGSLAYRSTLASSAADTTVSFPREMAQAFGCAYRETSVNPNEAEIAACRGQAAGKHVVVGLYNGQFNTGQLDLCRALSQAGCRLTAVALRNPYDLRRLPEGATAIAAYEYTHEVFAALIRLFKGEILPTGKIMF